MWVLENHSVLFMTQMYGRYMRDEAAVSEKSSVCQGLVEDSSLEGMLANFGSRKGVVA